MNQKVTEGGTPSAAPDGRGVSQVVFVAIGLAIITAGLWSLYMGDAPYHPEDYVSQDGVLLATD